MLWTIAQTTNQTAGPTTNQDKPPAIMQFMPILIIIVVMYFFVFRSRKTQQKKLTDMLASLKKGDRIQTIGGIRGAVVEVREDEVVIKVDESSNAKVTFARSAIHRVLEEEKK